MSRFSNLAAPLVIGGSRLATAAVAAVQPESIVVTGNKIHPGFEAVMRTVNIGDLNLSSSAGVKEMEKRVAHAVASVCPALGPNSPSYEQRDYDACHKFAWAGARPQMDRAVARATQSSGRMH